MRKLLLKWLNKRDTADCPKYDDVLEFVFSDSKGLKYYKFKSDNDIPILRKLMITESYVNLVNGFTDAEVNKGLISIYNSINETKNGIMSPNISKACATISWLIGRSGTILNHEALYSLAAHYFIREDEVFGEVKDSIHAEKIQILKTEFSEGVKDWFFSQSLNKMYPFLTNEGELFESLLNESKIIMEAQMSLING